MNTITFSRSDVLNKNLISLHIPFSESKSIDFRVPLRVKSAVTDRVVIFKFDATKTSMEYELHEGWDGEEYHTYFKDTEDRDITVDIWYSPNL